MTMAETNRKTEISAKNFMTYSQMEILDQKNTVTKTKGSVMGSITEWK
jgi:hypothetical protein